MQLLLLLTSFALAGVTPATTGHVAITQEDLAHLQDEVVSDLDGVDVEVVARGDDPFGRSGFELRFEDAPFVAFTTAFERLPADGDPALALSLARQAGQPHSPEGEGQQHILDGVIASPVFETPPEIDLEVDVTVTFAGLVYTSNGALQEQTVAWNDSGDVRAFAAPQAEGHPGTHGGDTLREDKMGVFTRGSRPLA